MRYLCTLILLCSLMTSGCCVLRSSELSPFPPAPERVRGERDPVLGYNDENDSFEITEEAMRNATSDRLFLDEIMNWKRENGIK